MTHRLKPQNDMTHVMLDAKSLLDMQTWSQPCGGVNENSIYANVHTDANANANANVDVNVYSWNV